MRRCAISPLGSGIAWWTRDQETAEVGRVVVKRWWQKSIGLVCCRAVLRSVYRSMSIRVGAVVVVVVEERLVVVVKGLEGKAAQAQD
jgi:hypothetical protein